MPALHLRRHSKCITAPHHRWSRPTPRPRHPPRPSTQPPRPCRMLQASPAQAAPTIDPLALLGKLVTLQSAGQLTQAEYEQLKTALMHYGAAPQQMHA